MNFNLSHSTLQQSLGQTCTDIITGVTSVPNTVSISYDTGFHYASTAVLLYANDCVNAAQANINKQIADLKSSGKDNSLTQT